MSSSMGTVKTGVKESWVESPLVTIGKEYLGKALQSTDILVEHTYVHTHILYRGRDKCVPQHMLCVTRRRIYNAPPPYSDKYPF